MSDGLGVCGCFAGLSFGGFGLGCLLCLVLVRMLVFITLGWLGWFCCFRLCFVMHGLWILLLCGGF